MTTKTPEQIADDASPDFEAMGLNESFRKTMRTWIVAAIEADRAQRDITPEADTGFKIGDRVTLTGTSWDEFGMRDDSATISGIEKNTANPEFIAPDGRIFVIWQDGRDDYSAALA